MKQLLKKCSSLLLSFALLLSVMPRLHADENQEPVIVTKTAEQREGTDNIWEITLDINVNGDTKLYNLNDFIGKDFNIMDKEGIQVFDKDGILISDKIKWLDQFNEKGGFEVKLSEINISKFPLKIKYIVYIDENAEYSTHEGIKKYKTSGISKEDNKELPALIIYSSGNTVPNFLKIESPEVEYYKNTTYTVAHRVLLDKNENKHEIFNEKVRGRLGFITDAKARTDVVDGFDYGFYEAKTFKKVIVRENLVLWINYEPKDLSKITFTAKSGKSEYNGLEQELKGFTHNAQDGVQFPEIVAKSGKVSDVGVYKVTFENMGNKVKDSEGNRYYAEYKDGVFEITKKALEIKVIGKTLTQAYNGKEQVVNGFEIENKEKLPKGLNVSLKKDVKAEAKGTEVKKYMMGLTKDSFEITGDNAKNYEITLNVVDGYLEITKAQNSGNPGNSGNTGNSGSNSSSDSGSSSNSTITITENKNPLGNITDKNKKNENKDKETKKETVKSKLNTKDHFAYVKGYPDNTVRPDGLLTREEITEVFYRLLDEEYKGIIKSEKNNFSDVKVGSWSNAAISTLSNAGVVKGYKDGKFYPSKNVTRAELVAIALRLVGVDEKAKHQFNDVKGHWAEKEISSAVKRAWIKGYKDGSFKPDRYVTRAEFISFVNNVLDRHVKKENILKGTKDFKDLQDENKWYYAPIKAATNSYLYEEEEVKENSVTVKYQKWTKLLNAEKKM